MKELMKNFQTEQFQFTKPIEDDIKRLNEIYESCKYIENWTDNHGNEDESIYDFFIKNTNLPPNGIKDNSIIFTITDTILNEMIGYVQFYLGFPDKDTIWLTTLMISKEHQKKGYGKKIVDILQDKMMTIKEIRKLKLIISLKNWPALRFWIKNGFNRIFEISGDKIYSENTFSHIILGKDLR